MKDEKFKGLMGGMNDVLGFYERARTGYVIHTATDIKAVRTETPAYPTEIRRALSS